MYVPIDVGYPDDEHLEHLDDDQFLEGLGLYVVACCIAKRLKSDGVVTRKKLRRYGADDALIDALIDVGMFDTDAGDAGTDAVRITAWSKHNPAAADLANPGKLAHQRWHVKKNKPKPGCEWCEADGLADPQVNVEKCDPQCEPHASRNADTMRAAHAEVEEEGDLEEDIELPTTTGTNPTVVADPTPPPGGGRSVETRVAAAIATAADHATQQANPDRPDAYRASVIRRLTADGQTVPLLTQLALKHPDATPEELLDRTGVHTRPTPTAQTDPPTVHPAIAANRTACPTCEGMRHVETDDGTVTPCPDCQGVLAR